MEELEEAGWKASENMTDEEIKDIDLNEMFEEADQERRDSPDLVVIPRKFIMFHFLTKLIFCYSGLHQIQQEHCRKS